MHLYLLFCLSKTTNWNQLLMNTNVIITERLHCICPPGGANHKCLAIEMQKTIFICLHASAEKNNDFGEGIRQFSM